MARNESAMVPDPSITIGPYQVLQQTTGAYVARDTRAPLANQIAYKHASVDNVTAWCRAHAPTSQVEEAGPRPLAQEELR